MRGAIDEARETIGRLPAEHAGKLFVDEHGGVVNDIDRILSGRVKIVEAAHGGAWPCSPDADSALIERMIDAFGWEGSRGEPSYDPFSTT